MKVPPRPPANYMTKAERDKILTVLSGRDSWHGRRNYAIFSLMFLSGLRVSDVCHLRVEDVDLEGRSLYIRAGKGNKDRRVPITPKLTRILHGWITTTRRRCAGADSPWLFLHMKRQHRYHGHLLNPKAISHQVRNQIVPILLTCRGSLVQVQYRPPYEHSQTRRVPAPPGVVRCGCREPRAKRRLIPGAERADLAALPAIPSRRFTRGADAATQGPRSEDGDTLWFDPPTHRQKSGPWRKGWGPIEGNCVRSD